MRLLRRFNTRVDYIKNMNGLDDKMMIYPGQQLLVPVLFEKMPPMKPQPLPQPQPFNQDSLMNYISKITRFL